MTVTVGCIALEVRDPVQGVGVPTHLLYPARAAEREQAFGPYALAVATDAAIEGDALPLVVLSHGNGGSPWGYRDLAAHLVRSGFVVAMPEHPGNSRADNALAGTPANLANRPRHVGLVADAAFGHPAFDAKLIDQRYSVIGHSIGGYTALAVAGGHPLAMPNETADGKAHPVAVERDLRVSALVLLAPAAPWFLAPGALADVTAPILLFTGARDEIAPRMWADLILRGVPDPARVDHREIAGAGHFSFMSPFPPARVSPSFPPSQDPPGFDRAAYLPLLCDDVRAFLMSVHEPRATQT